MKANQSIQFSKIISQCSSKIKLASSLAVLGLLSACSDSTTVNTETGSFMKGQASGVIYTTETHTGVTDANGAYEYEPGENISFYLGGTKLGATVAASAELGPMDLVPGVTIPEAAKDVQDMFDLWWDDFGQDPQMDRRFELFNMLTLLYSADSDKMASNGISIDAATHVALANDNFNLMVESDDFYNHYNNRTLQIRMYDAYNAGAMDSARVIRREKALDDYAALLGLSPEIYVRDMLQRDEDADGVIDFTSSYTFDANLLFSGYQSPDYSYNAQYNEYGDWLGGDYDWDNDGVMDEVSVQTYDIHGNRLNYQSDYDADGIADEIYDYTYDANGNRISENYDWDGDGVAEQIYTYSYDADGNRTGYTGDDDADGVIDQIGTFTYDANGNQTSNSYDSDADGVADVIYTYTYDANGNQTSYSYDGDADGTPEWIYSYTYDANGNQLTNSYDSDGDGNPNRIYTYTYDANGNRTEETRDYDGDGIVDRIYTYTYDANGNRILEERDENADGTIDRLYTYTYDANGNQTSYTQDNDADGIPNYIRTYTYDADGNRIERTYDNDGNGVIDRIQTYTYDANGNQLSYSNDSDADGVADSITTYTYQLINFLGWYTWD